MDRFSHEPVHGVEEDAEEEQLPEPERGIVKPPKDFPPTAPPKKNP